ncbi:uncharacterized protein B0H18DRAFT_963269 [Fomitopsis serialis]|uniref:uncharacterized protein n=1 Tax=Fomitopsis serialis TaxID=139415 RepID=UPI002008D06A|nr:uncharacterized protein B0H18DRAFT_963269 [Neoantrodia serialis]KAH9910472.1 hypothetical protein B0H18DRAFT_963269 [Neoantrodia serialis]
MGKKRTIEELLGDTCGACNRPFKSTKSLMAHQSSSQQCAWYKRGKLKEAFRFPDARGDEGEDVPAVEGSSGGRSDYASNQIASGSGSGRRSRSMSTPSVPEEDDATGPSASRRSIKFYVETVNTASSR